MVEDLLHSSRTLYYGRLSIFESELLLDALDSLGVNHQEELLHAEEIEIAGKNA